MTDQDLDDILRKEVGGQHDSAEAVKQLFDDKIEIETSRRSIDLKTDLTDRQSHLIACLDFFTHAGVFRPCLDTFTHSLKRNLVSKNRKGRGEAVEIFKNTLGANRHKGFLGGLLGGPKNDQ